MYSLLETNIDIEQFLKTIHRYVQLGVHIKGYYSQKYKRFHREVSEVVEFYVTDDNEAKYKILYKKTPEGQESIANPSKYLISYLESQGVIMPNDILVKEEFTDLNKVSESKNNNFVVDNSNKSLDNSALFSVNHSNHQSSHFYQNQINSSSSQYRNEVNNQIPNIYAQNQSNPRPVNISSMNDRTFK